MNNFAFRFKLGFCFLHIVDICGVVALTFFVVCQQKQNVRFFVYSDDLITIKPLSFVSIFTYRVNVNQLLGKN